MSLPKPYYEDTRAGITIYHGDCRDILPHLPKVDLFFTSPPYNLGNNHHTGNIKTQSYPDNLPEDEYQDRQIEMLCLAWLKSSGDFFYNHQHRIRGGELLKPDSWILRTPWKIKQEIVWNRGTPNMDKARFFPFTERIYWLSKKGSSMSFINGWGMTDDLHISPVGAGGEHKRQFPQSLVGKILSCTNATIVSDPYMGAGTTIRAAKDLGLKAIGIEIEEKYCEIAVKRLAQEVLPL